MTQISNEEQGNKLIWEFVSYLSRLWYLISSLMVLLYENIESANHVLEEEFNNVSAENKTQWRSKSNHQVLKTTIEINKNGKNIDLAVIIWNQFAHFWMLLLCFRKQINSLTLKPTELKELKKLIWRLDELIKLRNHLLHGFLVSSEDDRGLGILRYRYEQDWKLVQVEDIGWHLDVEIKEMISTWSDIKSWIYKIVHEHKK